VDNPVAVVKRIEKKETGKISGSAVVAALSGNLLRLTRFVKLNPLVIGSGIPLFFSVQFPDPTNLGTADHPITVSRLLVIE